MKRNKSESKEGFTIIEVVLVLAIAGLIMLMVFIALPALQRSQRDTQRRQDLSRALTAVQNYQANNKNDIPKFDDDFITRYLETAGDTFQDPAGDAYVFYSDANGTTKGIGTCVKSSDKDNKCTVQATNNFAAGRILALKNASCDGEKAVYVSGTNKYALLMKLEGAGVACVSN